MNPLRSFKDAAPRLGQRVYVDPAASVIGDVVLGDDVSIWPGTVLRGDVNHIRVGAKTSIQDGAIVHVAHAGPYGPGFPCLIGEGVTIGHAAVVHACSIGDYCLVGMLATVMDGAIVHTHGFVGAGALIPPGKVVGEGELWLGNPARFVRLLSDREIEQLHYSAEHYVRLKDAYLASA
jgi:carbonic anhydrase/acetyltransferase-like protein (isoleucine patch superfamily)